MTQRLLPGLAVVALVLWLVTGYRGIQWGDGLEFVAVSSHLGVAHPPGYPLFTLLGWLALQVLPLEPYRAVLALCQLAVLGIAIVFWQLLTRFERDTATPAMLIARLLFVAALVLSPTLTEAAKFIEVYAFSSLLVLTVVSLTLPIPSIPSRARLLTAGAFFGFAAANHLSSLSVGPLLLLACWSRWRQSRSPIEFLPIVLGGLVTLLLYASLFLRVDLQGGEGIFWGGLQSLGEGLHHFRGGEYRKFQFLMLSPAESFTPGSYIPFLIDRGLWFIREMGAYLVPRDTLLALPMGLLLLAAAVLGALWVYQENALGAMRLWLVGIAISLLLQVLFIATYNIPDIVDYFLSIHLLLAIFVGVSLLRILALTERIQRAGLGLLAAVALGAFLTAPRNEPTDPLAERYRLRMIENLPEGAALITQGDADIYTIWYTRFARGERKDLFAIGTGFIRLTWVRATLPLADPRRQLIVLEDKPPSGFAVFLRDLRINIIDPMIAVGPVYTTISDPMLLNALAGFYQIEPVIPLLTLEESQLIVEANLINFPPPILYRLEPLP